MCHTVCLTATVGFWSFCRSEHWRTRAARVWWTVAAHHYWYLSSALPVWPALLPSLTQTHTGCLFSTALQMSHLDSPLFRKLSFSSTCVLKCWNNNKKSLNKFDVFRGFSFVFKCRLVRWGLRKENRNTNVFFFWKSLIFY